MQGTFLKRIFGVGNEWEYEKTNSVKGRAEVFLKARREAIRCPKCGTDHIALRGSRDRRIRGVPVGLKGTSKIIF